MTGMIDEATKAIQKGELIVFPTDTVYGIGCDPLNESAIKLLYVIKKRPENKGIPILVDSIETAKEIGEISEYCEDLLNEYWPGALTVIVKQKKEFPTILSVNGTIALRQPNHSDLLELIKNAGGTLATTSANYSTKQPLLTYDEAYAMFSDKVSVVLPGYSKIGVPSTIIDCSSNKHTIVRNGSICIKV